MPELHRKGRHLYIFVGLGALVLTAGACGDEHSENLGRGAPCQAQQDCDWGQCHLGACIEHACLDNHITNDESDVDCGGLVCGPCPIASHCLLDWDCASGLCRNGNCQATQP